MGAQAKKYRARKAPKQARSQFTVEAVLKAAERVLISEGYEATTTSEVAKVAGVSIGSLYQYFPSKEALVGALIDRHVTELEEVLNQKIDQVLGKDPPLDIAARELVQAFVAVYHHSPRLHRLLIEQVPRLERQERWLALEQQMTRIVAAGLEAHAPFILIRNFDLAAFVLVQSIQAVVRTTLLYNPEHLEDEALIEELRALIVRYVGERRVG